MVDDDDALAAELAAEAVAASPEEPEAPTIERMERLAAEVIDIDDRIAKNEKRIKELKERREAIITADLVEMMDEARVKMLQVGGKIFKTQPYYKAGIPVAEQDHPGYAWLEENNAGDLIKNSVVTEFPRGSEDDAKLAEDMIRKRFQMATVYRRREVHWATLTSWLKETYQSSDPNKVLPPLDMINGSVGRIVKISNAKE